MRTIIELPEEQLQALGEICAREGISRAEAIRRAVAEWTGRRRHSLGEAFGMWSDRELEGRAWEDGLRDEWGPRARPV